MSEKNELPLLTAEMAKYSWDHLPASENSTCGNAKVALALHAIATGAAVVIPADKLEALERDAARVEALERLLNRTITYYNANGKVVEAAATDIFIQAGHRENCVTICLRRGHMDMKRHIGAGNVRKAIDVMMGAEDAEDSVEKEQAQ